MEGSAGERKKVGYQFYKKSVSSRMLTPYRSAQSHNGKIATLSQEVFRVMANCNEFVTLEERKELLEDLSDRLRISGYPVKISGKVMLNGLKCYFSKVQKAEKSSKMFHRPENEGKLERKLSKLAGKATWFRPGAGKMKEKGYIEQENKSLQRDTYRAVLGYGGRNGDKRR